MQERVSIKNKQGEVLAGLHDLPEEEKDKYPTVVLAHGFGAEKTESGMFDDIAQRLVKDGCQVFRFDFSGLGESQGDYSKTTISKQAEELEMILDYAKQNPLTDKDRIGLLGMSLGTSVITALQPKNIKAFVYLGSVSEPHKTLKILFGAGYRPEGVSERTTSEGKHIKMEGDFWKDFDRYNLPDLIKNLKAPILFIHGEKDSAVGSESAELFYKNVEGEKQLKIIQNADHGFYETNERTEMVELVSKWFAKYLK